MIIAILAATLNWWARGLFGVLGTAIFLTLALIYSALRKWRSPAARIQFMFLICLVGVLRFFNARIPMIAEAAGFAVTFLALGVLIVIGQRELKRSKAEFSSLESAPDRTP